MAARAWSKSPRRYPTASGQPQAQPNVKTDGAKQVGQLKASTGRPSGPSGQGVNGVRFTLEDANHAFWDTPQKGVVD
jgi:hypothetical protein